MKNRIIVTGAAGFIGRNIVAELNNRGQEDLILVDLLGRDDKWKNLVGLKYEDLLSPDHALNQLLHGELPNIEAIIHLGACSATTEQNADYLLENNYRYTRQLCEWCLKHQARFVYASSAATYGDGSQGYSDQDTITPTLRPMNMYGYSKHMFDLWALRRGLFDRIVGLKYFNVYGPYEAHKTDMRSVVHKAFGQIREKGYLELFKSDHPDYADGEQKRDFIYVRDIADITLHFMQHRNHSGLLNCGTGKARTWKDLAHAVFAAMNKPVDIRYVDLPPVLRGKYQYFTQAETVKLRAAGYTAPFTELEDGVRDYITHYLMV